MTSRRSFEIQNFEDGGFAATYRCNSVCKHCLYNCSPKWNAEFAQPDLVEDVLAKLSFLGVKSLHIGGGEPLMDREALYEVIRAFNRSKVEITWLETNASWCTGGGTVSEVLLAVKELGIRKFLISVSPFHNEFIPFYRTKALMDGCRSLSIEPMMWLEHYYDIIDSFDDRITHSMNEYVEKYGKNFVADTAKKYHMTIQGRFLSEYRSNFSVLPVSQILADSLGECGELLDDTFYHVDLYGHCYADCPGISIDYEDIGSEIRETKYPIFHLLLTKGIRGLYKEACSNYGYQPKDGYISKCDLCFDIRKHLVKNRNMVTRDLQPVNFYHYK